MKKMIDGKIHEEKKQKFKIGKSPKEKPLHLGPNQV